MSNRKSSITAEIKLAGQAKFKSDLAGVTSAAKGAASQIKAIPPPDFGNTALKQAKFAASEQGKIFSDNLAKGTAKLRAELGIRTQAEIREAQKAELAIRRIRHSSLSSSGSGPQSGRMAGAGGNGRGIGSAYGLSVGYNFAQDLAQGGIAGVANNIPQVIEMVGNSPKLKSLLVAGAGVASAALTSALAVFSYKKNVYDVSGAGFENEVERRQTAAKALSRSAQYRRENAATMAGAETRGESVATSYQQAGIRARQAADAASNLADREEAIADANYKVAMAKAESIQDEITRNEATSRLERERIEEAYQAKLKAIEKEDAIIRNEYRVAAEKAAGLQKGFDAKPSAMIGPEEAADRRVLQIALEAARAREEEAKQALAQIDLAKENHLATRQVIEAEKELISIRERGTLTSLSTARQAEREAANAEEEKQANLQIQKNSEIVRDFRRAKQEYDNAQFEKNKAKQAEADSLTEKESMSRMTPRKLEKYQKEKRMAEEKKRLVGLGFDPETAASMAERGEKLNERAAMDQMNPKRIRGAGYAGQKDTRVTGLGTSTFDGLAELSAMQGDNMPGAPSAGRGIKGAGYKEPKQKNDGVSIARPDPLTSLLIKGLAAIEKAVRETGPSSNDRAKPLSTANR